jgi:hypothetical protein
MSPVPTIAEFAVIACLFLIFIAVYDARNALVKLVEIMKNSGGFEYDEDDRIECPQCRFMAGMTDGEYHYLQWSLAEPDVGQCPNCLRFYQNLNTKDEPHLKELRRRIT